MDREKVIQGLEHCMIMCEGVSHNPCQGCLYQGRYDCADTLKADALALLKEREDEKKRIMKVIWDILHEGLSIDTVADQDWVYEQIRHRIEDT